MSIKVKISATTTQFKNGLKSAQNAASKTAANIKSSFRAIGAGIAGFIGVAAIRSAVASTTARLDSLKKSADNLQMDTDEFQKFSHAAQLAGSSAAEFEKGTATMQQSLGNALEGMQGDIDKFNRLGINPETLRGKEVHTQLQIVYDSLMAIEVPAQRTAAAIALFGRSGRRIAGLAADWRALTKEAEKKVVSKEQLEAVEKYNDAMLELQLTISKMVTGSGLLQFLTKVAEKLDLVYNVDTVPDPKNDIIADARRRPGASDIAKNNMMIEKQKQLDELSVPRVQPMPYNNFGTIGNPDQNFAYIPAQDPDAAYQVALKNKIAALRKGPTKDEIEAYLDEHPELRKKEEADIKRLTAEIKKMTEALGDLTPEEKAKLKDPEEFNHINDYYVQRDKLKAMTAEREQKALPLKTAKADNIAALNATEQEALAINKAATMDELVKILQGIKEARALAEAQEKATQTVKDTIAEYQKKVKWQNMLNDGKEREVAIEEALARATERAGRALTDKEREDLSKSVGEYVDAKKKEAAETGATPQTFARSEFKGDSVLAMGGTLGNQAKMNNERDKILRDQYKVQRETRDEVANISHRQQSALFVDQTGRFQ